MAYNDYPIVVPSSTADKHEEALEEARVCERNPLNVRLESGNSSKRVDSKGIEDADGPLLSRLVGSSHELSNEREKQERCGRQNR